MMAPKNSDQSSGFLRRMKARAAVNQAINKRVFGLITIFAVVLLGLILWRVPSFFTGFLAEIAKPVLLQTIILMAILVVIACPAFYFLHRSEVRARQALTPNFHRLATIQRIVAASDPKSKQMFEFGLEAMSNALLLSNDTETTDQCERLIDGLAYCIKAGEAPPELSDDERREIATLLDSLGTAIESAYERRCQLLKLSNSPNLAPKTI